MADDVAADKTAEGTQAQEQQQQVPQEDSPEVKALKDELAKEKQRSVSFERAITRQGHELTDQRKLLDKILQANLVQKEEKVDFFTDPEGALNQRLMSHPVIQGLAQATQTAKQQQMQSQLSTKHPDYRDVARGEDFLKWVSNSTERAKMYWKAENEWDFSAADYLLSEWKEKKQVSATAKAEAEAKAKTDADLKAAKVSTGGSSTGSKKTYTSEELQRLRMSDPDKYNALNPLQLYAEGRVKKAKEIS